MITFSFEAIEALFGSFFWPFVRVLALFSVAPIIGQRTVPARLRIGLAALIAFLVAPGAGPAPEGSLSSAAAFVLLAQNMLVGIAIGFSMRVAFAAMELAGDLIGLQMGLSFAGFVNPQSSAQTPLLGSYVSTIATIVFLGMDGHLAMIASVTDSFRSVPVDAGFAGLMHWERLGALGAGLFANGLHIALPVIASMLIVNLALGVVARAAPSLNIFSVGFPVTLITGLALLTFMLPYIMARFVQVLNGSFTALF
jgi:flagellar biosynthetic protein FliR